MINQQALFLGICALIGLGLDLYFVIKTVRKGDQHGLRNDLKKIFLVILGMILIGGIIFSAFNLYSGQVQIISDPNPATIYIDGKEWGQTPMMIPSLYPSKYELRVESENYDSWDAVIEVKPQEQLIIYAYLNPKSGILDLEIIPDGVTVYIDGILSSPATNEQTKSLPIGNHTLQLIKTGYITKSMDIVINYNEISSITCHLLPQTGTINITSTPKGANVYIDNTFAGLTPLICDDLRFGLYSVTVSKDGFVPITRQLIVQEESTTDYSFVLNSVVD